MRKLAIFIVTLLPLCILLIRGSRLVSAASQQAIFYVSPTGDDQNPGSLEKPFKTLEKVRNVIRTINSSMT